jgi:hypothetical protein
MSSQEELADGLRRLAEALASHHARRLSIVRDDDKPPVARLDRDKSVRNVFFLTAVVERK